MNGPFYRTAGAVAKVVYALHRIVRPRRSELHDRGEFNSLGKFNHAADHHTVPLIRR